MALLHKVRNVKIKSSIQVDGVERFQSSSVP